MSRQRAKQQVGVALFPFLAVLICTMGALIVLLVLLMQQARIDATEIAAVKAASQSEGGQQRLLRERLEDAKWRQELLEKSRAEKNQELADSRAKLAHLEEHSQRLAERARELLQQAKAIDEGRTLRDDELDHARSEAARLQKEIEQQKRAIDGQQKQTPGSKDSYALIPYEGRSGTRRRPIYVECTEFGVIIQPEGLLLQPQDFMGPLGPGNPLDMALRSATREHLESTLGNAAGQPYPLLVVRPGGVVAYEKAKAAMKAWDDEFGYELISEELVLDFGSPDPMLSSRLKKTVADAHSRQAAMIAMMPRRYQETPLVSAASDEPAVSGSRSGGLAGSGFGGSGAGGGFGNGVGSAGFGSGGSGMGAGAATTGGSLAGGYGSAAPRGNGSGTALPAGAMSSGGGATQPGSGIGGASGQNQPLGGGSSGTSTSGRSSGAMAGATAASGSTSPGASGTGQPGSSAPMGGSSMGGSSASGSSAGTPMPSMSFGDSKTAKAASGSSGGKAGKSSSRASSSKGKNWALPNAKTNHIGVTRPIKMAILADRIVLAQELGGRSSSNVVAVAPELTHDNVQQVVTAVQKEVEGWGLAVADGYWKPVLQADVAPGAEQHFQNLQTALNGSGIEITRR